MANPLLDHVAHNSEMLSVVIGKPDR